MSFTILFITKTVWVWLYNLIGWFIISCFIADCATGLVRIKEMNLDQRNRTNWAIPTTCVSDDAKTFKGLIRQICLFCFFWTPGPGNSWILFRLWCWVKPISVKHLRFLVWLNSWDSLMSFSNWLTFRPKPITSLTWHRAAHTTGLLSALSKSGLFSGNKHRPFKSSNLFIVVDLNSASCNEGCF